MAVMLIVGALECTRQRVLQEPVPVVQPDWVSEARREAQRQAWVNPLQPHDNLMPGGVK